MRRIMMGMVFRREGRRRSIGSNGVWEGWVGEKGEEEMVSDLYVIMRLLSGI
jgi:hypothetical protein